jgi:endonuclease YncB( thermonuclease family)
MFGMVQYSQFSKAMDCPIDARFHAGLARFLAMRLAFLLLLFLAAACHAAIIEGRVVGVTDGDTVTVLDGGKVQHKIRLAGIDAPEKAQPFGNRSKASLSDLVFGKAVIVDTGKKDRNGREVGKVLVNGMDANLEQVKRGMAWHYLAYEREQSASDRQLYGAAETEARAAKRGLWHDKEPTPPWAWRKERRDGH